MRDGVVGYARDEFLALTRWKTQRTKSRCESNTEAAVRQMTALGLSTTDERLRIESLVALHGVERRTASVLLHFAHRDPYPIIDFRALWSLGVDEEPKYYSFALWDAYVAACRSLAKRAGVSMRVFDRALWQYSKEKQPPRGAGVPGRAKSPMSLRNDDSQPNKSATMRGLFEAGQTVAQVAKALGVNYSFAHGVHTRWRKSKVDR